jgi:hypothetical protein
MQISSKRSLTQDFNQCENNDINKPVSANAHSSIPDNLDSDLNVTDEDDLHRKSIQNPTPNTQNPTSKTQDFS